MQFVQKEQKQTSYKTMSWLVKLGTNVMIGPKPATEEDVGHLLMHCNATRMIYLHTSSYNNSTQVEKWCENVLKTQDVEDRHRYKFYEHTFDFQTYRPNGRDENAKRKDVAAFCVTEAEKIWSALHPFDVQRDTVYLYYRQGTLEEVYIGFALWRLVSDGVKALEQQLPKDPIKWMLDNDYERLLNEDADNKALLQEIWNRTAVVLRSRKMFGRQPKVKKSKKL